MDKRRSAVVAVAILLAVVAATAVFLVLKSSDDDKKAAPGEKMVLVASSAIPANTKVSQIVSAGLARVESRPEASVPIGALTSINDLGTADYAQLVTASDVPATTTLTRSLFVQPGERFASFNTALKPNEQLITIPAGQIKTLTAGLLRPGDRVNIIITTPSTSFAGTVDGGQPLTVPNPDEQSQNSAPTQVTGYLLQAVEVYAVGATTAVPQQAATQTAEGQAAASVASADITFRVNAIEAEKLVRAVHGGASPGELWLTLVSQDFASGRTSAITDRSLLTDNYVDGASAKEPKAPIVETSASTTSVASSGSK